AAAIGLPAGDSGCVALIGVRDAAVVFFLELVFDGVGRGVAAQPEMLDELLTLFFRLEALAGRALLIRDDVSDLFVQPVAVRRFQLLAEPLFFLFTLLLGHRPRDSFACRLSGLLLVLIALLGRRQAHQYRHRYAGYREARSLHNAPEAVNYFR